MNNDELKQMDHMLKHGSEKFQQIMAERHALLEEIKAKEDEKNDRTKSPKTNKFGRSATLLKKTLKSDVQSVISKGGFSKNKNKLEALQKSSITKAAIEKTEQTPTSKYYAAEVIGTLESKSRKHIYMKDIC